MLRLHWWMPFNEWNRTWNIETIISRVRRENCYAAAVSRNRWWRNALDVSDVDTVVWLKAGDLVPCNLSQAWWITRIMFYCLTSCRRIPLRKTSFFNEIHGKRVRSFFITYESHATTWDSTVIDDVWEKNLLCSLISFPLFSQPLARSTVALAQSLAIHKPNLLSVNKTTWGHRWKRELASTLSVFVVKVMLSQEIYLH